MLVEKGRGVRNVSLYLRFARCRAARLLLIMMVVEHQHEACPRGTDYHCLPTPSGPQFSRPSDRWRGISQLRMKPGWIAQDLAFAPSVL